MNIEDLNKSQLLLLTILVNFITSIATGILTVSLLDQAPPIVTQTVNRIVEQTVQTVTPGASSVITKQTTVVDKQQDLVVAAIAAQAARTVRVYDTDARERNPDVAPAAIGTYLPKTRAVVTAGAKNLPAQATIVFPDGSSAAVSLARETDTVAIYGFADSAALPDAPAPVRVAASDVKQGETVIALTADGSAVTGIVSRVDSDKIYTTLPATPVGSGAVNLDGDLIGISSDGAGLYVSAGEVTAALTATSTSATSE
ncbi:MAG: hypothetical protein WDN10_01565 [bacterium]